LYYKSKLESKDKDLSIKIEELHKDEDDTLGHKKVGPMLGVGKNRAKRVMKKYGIEPRKRKSKYFYRGKSDKTFENLANEPEIMICDYPVIFSDMFEFKLLDGSVVRGCFALHKQTRQILSLAFDYWMKADLVTTTMERIDFKYEGSIWHTDQGKQYGAGITLEKILQKGFIASMSRAGTPTDNGYAERFVGIFKHAVVRKQKYETIGEFLKVAEKWINFYNYKRPHEGLGQISPVNYAIQNCMQVVPILSNLFV
jgi:transposase InsO family protein